MIPPAGGGTAEPASGAGLVPRRRTIPPWPAFALRRAAGLALTFVALLVVSFGIVALIPGDPAVALAGPDATTTEVEALRHELGLDRPLPVQLADHVAGVLTGDLGTSFQYRQPVLDIIGSRLPFTATIAVTGIVVVLLVAVPLGMAVGALTRGGRRRWLDTAFGSVTGLLDAVPSYVMATGLVVLLATGVGLLDLYPPAYTARNPSGSLVLPVLAIVIGPVCTLSRVVRREVAVVLAQDHLRTARGWRLPPATILVRYALPNLMTSTLTLSGMIFSGMLGGALVIESVFALPGLGSGIIRAILDRDYPVIQGMVLVIGMLAALVTVLVDVVLGLIDPRTLGGHRAAD